MIVHPAQTLGITCEEFFFHSQDLIVLESCLLISNAFLGRPWTNCFHIRSASWSCDANSGRAQCFVTKVVSY